MAGREDHTVAARQRRLNVIQSFDAQPFIDVAAVDTGEARERHQHAGDGIKHAVDYRFGVLVRQRETEVLVRHASQPRHGPVEKRKVAARRSKSLLARSEL